MSRPAGHRSAQPGARTRAAVPPEHRPHATRHTPTAESSVPNTSPFSPNGDARISAAPCLAGCGGDQFQILGAEDRQMVHRSQRVIAARGHREAEALIGLQPGIDPIAHVDHHVIERRHRQCHGHGVASPARLRVPGRGDAIAAAGASPAPRPVRQQNDDAPKGAAKFGGETSRGGWRGAIRRTEAHCALSDGMSSSQLRSGYSLSASALTFASRAWPSAATMTDLAASLRAARCCETPRAGLAARKIRQALPQRRKSLPWIGPQSGEPFRHVPQRELRRIQLAIDLVPRHRRRHGRAGRARADRTRRSRWRPGRCAASRSGSCRADPPSSPSTDSDPAVPGSASRRRRGRTASPHPNARPARAARRHADPCRRWCGRTTSARGAAVGRARRVRPSTTSVNATPSPGSRSNTIRSGCSGSASVAPQACSSIADICAMAISPSASSIARYGGPSASPWRIGDGNAPWPCFWKKCSPADAFRAAHDGERPARQPRQRMVGDRDASIPRGPAW